MNMQNASARVARPAQARLAFVRALNMGDLETAVACFTRNGCLITPDTTAIHGRDRIRPVLAQMVARRTEIKVEMSTAIGAGEVILVHERWRISAATGKVPSVEQTLHPTLVLRRIEARWKLAIAAPWGWERVYP